MFLSDSKEVQIGHVVSL